VESINKILKSINSLVAKGYRAGGNYVPVTTLVHRKDGSVITAIRWKSLDEEGLVKVRAGQTPAVRTLQASIAFAAQSAIQQMMFLLIKEEDIPKIESSNFIPMIKYPILGEGLYMYSNLKIAQERAQKHNKQILPVKINVAKLHTSSFDKVKQENFDDIRKQGFDGIIIMRGSVHEFDVFCFDSRDVIAIGEIESEGTQE
jgi:hypothetical protein